MKISKETQNKILEIIRAAGRRVDSAHDVEAQDGSITVKPGTANFVTVFDLQVQETLIAGLRPLFPNAYFFAEEKENSAGFRDTVCIFIDPIDGTTNFIHDMKCSMISVGLYYNEEALFGAVYDPYKDEMFCAAAGEGAFLNGRRISVSDRPLEKALISFGTAPYNRDKLAAQTFARAKAVFLACADLRRSGSAAQDICFVACGRTDAYFEELLSPWDYAAGALILREAGGMLTDFSGNPPKSGEKSSVLCSNKALHPQMLSLINSISEEKTYG